MSNIKIPVYQPDLNGNESKYVNECLDSTWISSKGEFISKFEEGFARFTGSKHAAGVSNGTVALHVALVALGVGKEDEVIVPTFTYIASVNAIAYTGATPIFVDSDPETWQVDPVDIERKITPRTKAIMAVHLYGQACDMDAIMKIARKHKLYVVEDCAEAIGTYYKGAHVGNFGDIACYSFFGNKVITTGEGGMVTSNNPDLIDKVVHHKGQGLAKDREYWHDVIGFNYRLTNICAAIGLAQLERIEQFLTRKHDLASLYTKFLKGTGIELHKELDHAKHSYWMCSILVPDARMREPLREHLKAAGIETRPLFFPAHTMPIYKQDTTFPVAEDIAARGINLPSWPGLKDDQVKEICNAIKQFMEAPQLAS